MAENLTRDLTTGRRIAPPSIGQGQFHLLSIGINAYRNCPPLQTAVQGAREIARVLRDRFGFEQERVTLLLDDQATRSDLIRSLRDLARKLREDDSLLIFYAGHGYLDEFGLGFWIPVDASLDEPSEWISNSDIKNMLRVAKARHVLLVSDSCFSGDFFREAKPAAEITDAYVEMAFRKMSRQVLTSGGLEPVLDGGANGHSVFTYFLMKQLEESREPYVLAEDLFQRIRGGVAVNARQQVQLGILFEAGGEVGGEFVLFRHGGSEALEAAIDEKREQLIELDRREQEAKEAARAQEAVLEQRTQELHALEARIQELEERLGGGRREEELDRLVALAEQKKQESLTLTRLKAEAAEAGRRKEAELERLRREDEAKRQLEFEADCAKWENIRSNQQSEVTRKGWEALCGKWGIRPFVQGRLRRKDGKVFLNWQNSLGMKLVLVPGTDVMFSVWETQVQEFEIFVKATGCPWSKAGFKQSAPHPVVNVCWEDAKAFCAWLTKKEKKEGLLAETQKYRLPTDLEWSIAVGLPAETGQTPSERSMKLQKVYPWGSQWPPPKGAGNYGLRLNVDVHAFTSPVGFFAPNQFGIYDLGGNVWEWCEDWYDPRQAARVSRGASWYDIEPELLLSSFRNGVRPEFGHDTVGFRIVLAGASSP